MANEVDAKGLNPVEDVAEPTIDSPGHGAAVFNESGQLILPPGWLYRRFRLGKHQSPWYASPKVQLVLVALVCFLCPGMFNALNGLGGGGKTDATLADHMVSSISSMIFSFLTGLIEHCSVLYFRRLRFLWRYYHQQDRC